jgi:4-hydroxyacetophenone monooxygenase
MTADFRELVREEARLRAALDQADIVPLLMVLVQLSGETELLDAAQGATHGPWDYSENLAPELKARIRDRLVGTLKDYAAHDRALPPPPSGALLRQMMSVAAGEPISDEYVPMMLEEMALHAADPKGVSWHRKPDAATLQRFKVVVIGAGMSGLLSAIRLSEAGIPYEIYEKNETVGGTWYENSYPGCGVDTPNHFYSYSFDSNPDWTHFFSKRDELWRYFEACADRYAIRARIRFNTEITAAHYDAERGIWHLRARDRAGKEQHIEANAVISAVGQLNRPAVPRIAGMETFNGPVFHTGQWDHSVKVEGKRVAMIGTGASGMQVGPTIAPQVARLSIFQRSPHWVVPNPNYHRVVSDGKKWLLRHLPYYGRWYRFQLFWGFADGLHPALQKDDGWDKPQQSLNPISERYRQNMIKHIKREIGDDPVLLAKVIPPYPPYGKRILIDNHWYKMLKRPNVDLVTEPIERIEPGGVRTKDGALHPADVIVLATGFQAGRMLHPMDIRGKSGRSLREIWGEDNPRAYLGITVPDFPNLFVLYGPNTNLGHGGSAIFHAECQVRYVMQCLRDLLENDWRSMEVRADVHDAYNTRVDAAHERMVWTHKGMSTWYKNSQGRVITNSPWRLVDYWAMTREPKRTDYIVQPNDAARRSGA